MTPSARIAAVIEIYDTILSVAKPSDQVLQTYFRSRKFIGSKDRKYIAEMLYQLLRHYARLNWWAEELDVTNDGRGCVLLWLSLGEGKDGDEIEELFSGEGYGAAILRESEVKLLDELAQQTIDTRDMPEAVRAECPDWAFASLKENFSDDFNDEMFAMQFEASLDLRVNTLRATRDKVLERLLDDHMDVAKTPYAPNGLRVSGRPAFSMHPLYQQGHIEVQDEGSQILAMLCGVKPGEWVVDFCAGAGGKTMALAAEMQNKGRIWACDTETTRLENARKRLRRADIHCVETKVLNNENDEWVKKHQGKADCVLIDAPCSGVGTWRRNPFARWQNLGPSLEELVAVQERILRSAARLVKPGGRLIYATCSMLPEENALQVKKFMAANPEFKPAPLSRFWSQSQLELDASMLQLTPFQHRTDGFFAAVMVRD